MIIWIVGNAATRNTLTEPDKEFKIFRYLKKLVGKYISYYIA